MLESQKYAIDFMTKIGGKENGVLYEELFKTMTNKEYKIWVEKHLRTGRFHILVPQDGSVKITPETSIKMIEKMGGSIHGNLTIEKSDGTIEETNIPFYVIDINLRTPVQTADKAISVSDKRNINAMTGQQSSSSKITSPEIGLLNGLGLKDVLKELLRVRGGDVGLQQALSAMLSKTGKVSYEDIKEYSTGIISTNTLVQYFKAIHIKLFDD